MAYDYSRLKEIAWIADSVASVYTLPASTTAYIRYIIIHNTNTTDETVEIHVVPDDSGVGTAADANKVWHLTLSADETWEWYAGAKNPGIILSDENDSIQATTTTASKVNIQIYGGTE